MPEIDKNIFGLDISDRTLRLVKLQKTGKKIFLVSFNEVEVPANIINHGQIIEAEKLTAVMKQLTKTVWGKKIKTKCVIAVLPETQTFIKVITLPPAKNENEKELVNSIYEEIKNHIPLPPEEIYLDWQIISETAEIVKVLVGAAPKTVVDSYYSVLTASGYTTFVLEIEAAAIARCLIPPGNSQSKIIIDFGANRTGLIIYDEQVPQFTVSLPISGEKITQTIAATLRLDPKKAEEAKIVCGLNPAKCDDVLAKILMAPLADLAKEINKAIVYYKTNYPSNNQIEEIILTGGGANFANIDKVLTAKLKIPVSIGNSLANITLAKRLPLPKDKILSYTTAIGLALRPYQKK